MRSNSNEMYTSGEYLAKNPCWHEQDAPWKAAGISRLLQRNDITVNKIIDIGCGSGGILEQLSQRHNSVQELKGYDISPQAITLAKAREKDGLTFINEDFFEGKETADLVLVIDVLEHVDDFYKFLRLLRHRGDFFIFHIPLDLCCRSLLKPHVLLQQRRDVGHIHYFSQEMVNWLLSDTGYLVIDWEFTKPLIDTDPADSLKRRLKKMLRNFSFAINKETSARLWGGYSMMILAK